ncbi:MAG TPA: non-ribosomal peptide synthetase, partial [Thermoanaerobaculia bacterium]|nr:non-ribosomal peptide synthetase [Thermoanaerobaculia bacterium]
KAGGVYLPLDPEQPFERLETMLEDAGCTTVLAGAAPLAAAGRPLRRIDLRAAEVWSADSAPLRLPLPLDRLAYIVYTSGSTGRPKGIGLPHRLLASLVAWQIQVTPVPALRTLQLGSPGFDISVQETQVTWCAGGTVVAAPEAARRDPAALARLLSEARVERLYVTFVVLQQLAEHLDGAADLPLALREVITAGERLQVTPPIRALLRRLPGCVLRNQYGPSETHVVTEHILPSDPESWPALPPIGRPISGTRADVVDATFRPVPAGVPGELLLGGESLGRGYVGRPDWTAVRFIPDPLSGDSGARLYRTGDLTRLRPDGEIDFLGRIDHQVKVRGYRVEPEEIEAALLAHPAVHEAAVAALTEDRTARLVAFVVADALPDLPAELRRHLSGTLPAYMVPSAFVALEALPLTRTGKVDRRALPALADGATGQATAAEYVPPGTPLEKALGEIFEEVLRIEKGRVGLRDNFFDLGGHSLLATRVMALLQDRTGIDLPMRTLFEATDLEDLAQRIIEEEVLDAPDDLLEELTAEREG